MIPIVLGITGIVVCVFLHSITTSIIVHYLLKYGRPLHARFGAVSRPFILGSTAAALAFKHLVDIVLWGTAYFFFAGHKELPDFETSVYFSSVTYTTLGFGDIVLSGTWRIMCGMEAMCGILVFGWSTALLFVIVQQIWFTSDSDSRNSNQEDIGY